MFEIKSMAVIPSSQRKGIGRKLIEAAIQHCCALSGDRLVVSTAVADIGKLRFYQRCSFRMCSVVRDAFSPSTGYAADTFIDGIRLMDQVTFDLPLRAKDAQRLRR